MSLVAAYPVVAIVAATAGPRCTLYFVANSYLVAFALDRRQQQGTSAPRRSLAEVALATRIYIAVQDIVTDRPRGGERDRERESYC